MWQSVRNRMFLVRSASVQKTPERERVERELLEERVLEAGERPVPELIGLDADLDHVPDQLGVVAAGRALELGVRSVPKRHRLSFRCSVRTSARILPQHGRGGCSQKPSSRRPLIMWISVSKAEQPRRHATSSSAGPRHFVSAIRHVPSGRPTAGPGTIARRVDAEQPVGRRPHLVVDEQLLGMRR